MKPSNATSLSRRAALQKTSALGVAAVTGSLWSTAARAQASTSLETRAAKLGFIALTDAAPLFVADEKGYFKKHGMTDVEVLKQSSWGTTRDNLVLGSGKGGIDGAHILTPMPYLITTGAVTVTRGSRAARRNVWVPPPDSPETATREASAPSSPRRRKPIAFSSSIVVGTS